MGVFEKKILDVLDICCLAFMFDRFSCFRNITNIQSNSVKVRKVTLAGI